MLRTTIPRRIATHFNSKYRQRWAHYRHRELTRWQRESMGLSDWNYKHSSRPVPHQRRSNPESASLTKGTSAFAYKWWWFHQRFLPRVAPAGYERPVPVGRAAWPVDWDEAFAQRVTSMTESDLREAMMQQFTQVIFEETQRDGYELRRLDFESNPLTDLPTRDLIENFVLQEDTLKERVVRRIVEETYRIVPSSDQFAELNSVPNIIEFVVQRVRQCREPWKPREVTPTVMRFLAEQRTQPKFGFAFALPQDDRPQLLQEWEKLFHHDFQFGKAVFKPRKMENERGNLAWLRLEAQQRDREIFEADLQSGEAEKRHRTLIEEAAR